MSESKKKNPLLHRASSQGDIKKVNTLLEKNGGVNQKAGPYDETPLHIAAGQGHHEVVKALLLAEANVKAMDSFERTPIMLAAKNGHEQALQLLLEAFIAGEVQEDFTEERNDDNLTKAFSRVDLTGKTLLHFAAEGGSVQCVEMVLNTGMVDQEATDETGATPLHLASARGHIRVVDLLMDRGARLNARDLKGRTPLYQSVYNYQRGTSAMVINRGTSPKLNSKELIKQISNLTVGGGGGGDETKNVAEEEEDAEFFRDQDPAPVFKSNNNDDNENAPLA